MLWRNNQFDIEVLRNQKLIEEREIYENNFIIVEDIQKSDEMDYYTCPMFEEYFLIDFVYEDIMEKIDIGFDFEDFLENLRVEQLIKEREAYEMEYLSIKLETPDSDLLDLQIETFERHDCGPQYDYYPDDYYFEEYNMDAAYCGGSMYGYIVDDNESFEELDYPEGPDENLGGVRYFEPCYPVYFSDSCFEFPDDFYDCPEPDYIFEEQMTIDFYDNEESQIQRQIELYLNEEEQFLQFIADNEIQGGYLPPEAQDGMIIILN